MDKALVFSMPLVRESWLMKETLALIRPRFLTPNGPVSVLVLDRGSRRICKPALSLTVPQAAFRLCSLRNDSWRTNMTHGDGPVLTNQQFVDYEELGFVHSVPILSEDEITYYHAEVEEACLAVGGRVTRLDRLHLFMLGVGTGPRPRSLDCLERLLGPDILLKIDQVFFYKHAKSTSFVGWTRTALRRDWKTVTRRQCGSA